ncbi:hypothetical protein CPC08DRAFT_716895 [Agrocybe pediades]|nr:hypothetical protein CPC08DRAFT_716895 [Agrocybe pediades]
MGFARKLWMFSRLLPHWTAAVLYSIVVLWLDKLLGSERREVVNDNHSIETTLTSTFALLHIWKPLDSLCVL